CALVFLYRHVLRLRPPWIERLARPSRSDRLPVVLTRGEVFTVLDNMRGTPRLMAALLYGSGLRVLQCARLPVEGLRLAASQSLVRAGKGRRARLTLLPARLRRSLTEHLIKVRELHAADLDAGAGHVFLPDALVRKYPNASRTWPWQWVFPATRTYHDAQSGE